MTTQCDVQQVYLLFNRPAQMIFVSAGNRPRVRVFNNTVFCEMSFRTRVSAADSWLNAQTLTVQSPMLSQLELVERINDKMTSRSLYGVFFPDNHSGNSDLRFSRIPCLRKIKPTQACNGTERRLSIPAEKKERATRKTQQILAPANIIRPMLSVSGAAVPHLVLHLQKDSELKILSARFHSCASVLATTLSTEKKRTFESSNGQTQPNVRLKRREHRFTQSVYQFLPDFAEISISKKHRCRRIVKLPSISLCSSVFSLPEPSVLQDET